MSCAKAAVPAVAISGAAVVPVVIGAAAIAVAVVVAARAAQAEREKLIREERQARREAIRVEREKRMREGAETNARLVAAAEAFRATRGILEELKLTLGEKRKVHTAEVKPVDGRSPGPVDTQTAENAKTLLERINDFLMELPDNFQQDREWPYERFIAQAARFQERFDSGRHPDPGELITFHETIARTLKRFARNAEAAAEARLELFAEADRVLHEVLLTRHSAVKDEHRLRLGDMVDLLSRANTEAITWEILDKAQAVLAEIKPEVDADLQWIAFRQTLGESMVRHLEEMGYKNISAFGDPAQSSVTEAVFGVPGGERLSVAVGSDGRMDFRLSHEQRQAGAVLTEEEIRFFRQQEDKWSRDFRELVRRLTKEGFSYQVQAENLAAEGAIPIVVVETADEILREEEEREQLREREDAHRTH